MSITLNNISKTYGQRLIFKAVSCRLPPGNITLLAGQNGAGKSTFLSILAGLTPPDTGSIHRVPDQRFLLGTNLLGHKTFLYPDLSAKENLRFWAEYYRIPTADNQLEEALAQVSLTRFANEKTNTFSRGMAQRLNIARIFLSVPQLLLLDEPATGLDIQSSAMLHNAVLKAKAAGSSILWVSHSLTTDLPTADQVLYLEQKKLAFQGTAQRFLQSPYATHQNTPAEHIMQGTPRSQEADTSSKVFP